MRLISYFLPKAPYLFVYMLQLVEYDSIKLARWVFELPDLKNVQRRQKLVMTNRARLTLLVSYFAWLTPFVAGIAVWWLSGSLQPLIISLAAPFVGLASLTMFNSLFAALLVKPKEAREIRAAAKKLQAHPAQKIAVLGSYGKTSMKELLTTIIGQGKKVAASPANKNVLISHARWVSKTLAGDEEVLIFELGEYRPGDIAEMLAFCQPDMAVVTGLSSAHIENFGSLDAITKEFASVLSVCQARNVLFNAESPGLAEAFAGAVGYSRRGCGPLKTDNVQLDIDGTRFTLKHGKAKLSLHTGLLGAHQVGPLSAGLCLAQHFGLSEPQMKTGVAETKPFAHRLQPYRLGGAWVIDDTYNGNLEGMRAGLELLASLEAKRKIYVTPGLVELGEAAETIHLELGQLIASAKPDVVVLMQNSAAAHIQKGLDTGGFKGRLEIESQPLHFYTNLEHFVAAGDIVLMQNDWPDNYR